MKALSIRQPWAWLIVNGYKDVENRTWSTRHRGWFLVHAGKSFDRAGYEWVLQRFPHIKMPLPGEFELGGIVGKAFLTGSYGPDTVGASALSSPWYMGSHAFALEKASPLTFIPAKGLLNFFKILYPRTSDEI